ncbi:(S)-benzoin forming benzil reductase [Pedobacter sp. MW01-1-1]|uniref:(S)-benzoin forming benzil reductase n=1 Tax=Pedobacter sp. MW01-1-1 TaxID=3383027 RepID=UPI003FED7C06
MKKLLIITGGSKGIGSGIVEIYKNNDYKIISLSRTTNNGAGYYDVDQIEVDLSKIDSLAQNFKTIFSSLDEEKIQSITLINNAGTVGDIKSLADKSPEDIQHTLNLNTTAPLILSALFLKLTETWTCEKKIINISSGAAKNPYYGWSTYCASKAAIDMMTKVAAIEQSELKYGAKIIAIYPGVVDTDMQNSIRSADKKDFTDLEKFIEYKKTGKLADSRTVGSEIYTIDHDENFENGSIIHVNDIR